MSHRTRKMLPTDPPKWADEKTTPQRPYPWETECGHEVDPGTDECEAPHAPGERHPILLYGCPGFITDPDKAAAYIAEHEVMTLKLAIAGEHIAAMREVVDAAREAVAQIANYDENDAYHTLLAALSHLDEGREAVNEEREYRKTATVMARQMAEAFTVETLEGTMTGQPGDYLCRGPAGEEWPIKREIFEATYEPVDAS